MSIPIYLLAYFPYLNSSTIIALIDKTVNVCQ